MLLRHLGAAAATLPALEQPIAEWEAAAAALAASCARFAPDAASAVAMQVWGRRRARTTREWPADDCFALLPS
jgi:hypothetical protein